MATERPKAGQVETRHNEIATVGRKIRGVVPYGIESRDMGGWREVIEPTALRGTKLDELIARVDHTGVPIGRFPGTLDVEERTDGLHWSVTPPASRADLLEAIERGDLRAGSWQMVVSRDEWRGDTRHVHEISELRDVSVVSSPAYPAATVEYRAAPNTNTEEVTTVEQHNEKTEERDASSEQKTDTEERGVAELPDKGILRVEERAAPAPMFHSLADAFKARGFFENRSASVSWDEFRTLSWSAGTVLTDLNPVRNEGVGLGTDTRYLYPVFPSTAVDAGVSSVQTLHQSARTLAAGTAVVRALDSVTTKPEVATTTELVTTQLKQVAAIETNVPEILGQQPLFQSLVENDLRLSIYEGYDRLVSMASPLPARSVGARSMS